MPSEKAIEAFWKEYERLSCFSATLRNEAAMRAAILAYERERGISDEEVEAACMEFGSPAEETDMKLARCALTAAQAVRVKEIEG